MAGQAVQPPPPAVNDEVILRFSTGAEDAAMTAGKEYAVFTAPRRYVVEAITVRYVTAGASSNVIDAQVVASGTAHTSATSILSSTFDATQTAATNYQLALDTTKNIIEPGQTLYLTSATGTGANGVIATVRLRALP